MLLTLTTTTHQATDLGYLLHKHPDRVQRFDVMAGSARVFYPRADETECTAALLLEIDPVELVRHARVSSDFVLGRYINDRPYVASSLLAVALGKVFRTALNGRCDAKPDLAETRIPLRIHLPVVPDGGGDDLVPRLFEPMGWHVETRRLPLDDPDWGDSRYVEVNLRGSFRVADALNHLYVLLPVLDGAKHYWVGEEEVEKLLRAGGDWLAEHPERELISQRYLARARTLVDSALSQLSDPDTTTPDTVDESISDTQCGEPLTVSRRHEVLRVLNELGARRVIDLGCGDGALARDLLADPAFAEILGVDVSIGALRAAARKLDIDRLPDRQRARITLRQSSLTYTDSGLAGFDAAVLMEVIEHVDQDRLSALEHSVFGHAHPKAILVTTPNTEYNVKYPRLHGDHRHTDHRFEWTRTQFSAWAERVAREFGYHVRTSGIGEPDPILGAPSQLAVFTQSEDT